MNSFGKYMWLAIAFFTILACSSSRKSSSHGYKKSHALDSLPITIIKSKIEQPDSIVFIDTSSAIRDRELILALMGGHDEVSDKPLIMQENTTVCQFPELRHTELKEIELAIDDNGNNTYLDLDF